MRIQQNKEIISATNLFVFNPEHDLALAVGKFPYTPPSEVGKIRKEFSLLPALFAGNSDFIIVPDEVDMTQLHNLEFYNVARQKNIKIINFKSLPDYINKISSIVPWGWDNAIRELLLKNGAPESLLPSPEEIDMIRNLSHRKTAIKFRSVLASILNSPLINPPLELFSLDEVEEFLILHPLSYFKAPWSSSGRGIVVSDHITRKGLLEWAHGIIKKQGSVIAEPTWQRILDFASEWWIKEGKTEFIGFSVFETSSRGKYHRNIVGSQQQLLDMILKAAPSFNYKILEAQKEAISLFIAPNYSGPLGIDMLIDSMGRINPCVEINLRFTMGFINLIHDFKNL